MTQTISTIVDHSYQCEVPATVYMTQTISTIVDDTNLCAVVLARLYDPNNFYYCRFAHADLHGNLSI